jgi:hypothetical protein
MFSKIEYLFLFTVGLIIGLVVTSAPVSLHWDLAVLSTASKLSLSEVFQTT